MIGFIVSGASVGKPKCLSFIVFRWCAHFISCEWSSWSSVICLSWAYSHDYTVEYITNCNAVLPLVFVLLQIMPQSKAHGWQSSVVHKCDAVKHSCDGVLLLAEATPLWSNLLQFTTLMKRSFTSYKYLAGIGSCFNWAERYQCVSLICLSGQSMKQELWM